MGPGIPVVPDGCQFPGSCLVSCSQSSRLQMCGELVSTWGLSQMLNNAVDHGYMQHASSCMYKGLNVLYLCIFYHSNLSLECFFHNRNSNMYCAAGYWCMKHKNKTKQKNPSELDVPFEFCYTWYQDSGTACGNYHRSRKWEKKHISEIANFCAKYLSA